MLVRTCRLLIDGRGALLSCQWCGCEYDGRMHSTSDDFGAAQHDHDFCAEDERVDWAIFLRPSLKLQMRVFHGHLRWSVSVRDTSAAYDITWCRFPIIGKVGGPGGSDFGRLPTSNSRARASSVTARAMTVVCDNMRGDLCSWTRRQIRRPSGSNAVLHREGFIEAPDG
jgi:hypothetical protein